MILKVLAIFLSCHASRHRPLFRPPPKITSGTLLAPDDPKSLHACRRMHRLVEPGYPLALPRHLS